MYKSTVREEKRALRRKYSAVRHSMTKEMRLERSRIICRRFTETQAYRLADAILLYHSINDEVDTRELIDTVLASGKRLALPVCRENSQMSFKYITSREDLTDGFFSAPEPKAECEDFTGSRHPLCVIPAIAFDKRGYRLGYGKGYYDRYLTDPSIVKVGFVYDELLVDSLPKGRFDIACDMVITPKGVFNTGEK